jgi:hypothetical protein
MQLATRDVFGMKDADISKAALHLLANQSEEQVMESAGKTIHLYSNATVAGAPDAKITAAGMQEFIAGMYRATQADLAERGVKKVCVARAMAIGSSPDNPTLSEVKFQPASSFTADYKITNEFSGDKFLVKAPASQVLSTYLTGFGCTGEHEVVLLAHAGTKAIRIPLSIKPISLYDAVEAAAKEFAKQGLKE